MLVIRPVQEKEEQKRLCGLCEVTYCADALCYQAYDGDTFVGVCQFDLGDVGKIYDLKNPVGVEDEEALFIMGRQTLNFMDLCGTHDAVLQLQSPMTEHLIRWLGFRQKDGQWYMDLRGFFEEPCKHTKKE